MTFFMKLICAIASAKKKSDVFFLSTTLICVNGDCLHFVVVVDGVSMVAPYHIYRFNVSYNTITVTFPSKEACTKQNQNERKTVFMIFAMFTD